MPSKVLTRHPKFMSLFPNMPCRNYCSIHQCLNFSCLFFFAILIILMLANCYMGGKMTIGPSISSSTCLLPLPFFHATSLRLPPMQLLPRLHMLSRSHCPTAHNQAWKARTAPPYHLSWHHSRCKHVWYAAI